MRVRFMLSCVVVVLAYLGTAVSETPEESGFGAPEVVVLDHVGAAISPISVDTVILDAVGSSPRDPRVLRRADLGGPPRNVRPLVALEVHPITGEIKMLALSLGDQGVSATKNLIDTSFDLDAATCIGCGEGCPDPTRVRTVVVVLRATRDVYPGFGVSDLFSGNFPVSGVSQETNAYLEAGDLVQIDITGTVDDCGTTFRVYFDMCDNPPADATGECFASSRGDGTSQENAGRTCKTILDDGYSSGSGVYWIDPDDDGDTSNAFQIYCDMVNQDGGWTLVAGIDANREHVNPAAVTSSNLVSPEGKGKLDDATINLIKLGADPAYRLTCRTVTGYFQGSCTFGATTQAGGTCVAQSYEYPPTSYGTEQYSQIYIVALADGSHSNSDRLIYGTLESWLSGCDTSGGWGGTGALYVR